MIPEKLEQDLEDLRELGFSYELVEESSKVYIVFKDFPLPPRVYNMEKTDLLIFTTAHYSNAGFDMFWTDQDLTLRDGNIPNSAESIEPHLGKSWRRFSYHPYQDKPWNPSEDSVTKFIGYVQQRLHRGD